MLRARLCNGGVERAAAFYLPTFGVLILSLLWLYTTTPLSLAFLLPSSMNRTVSVFMALTPLAIAHLCSQLLAPGPSARRDQTAIHGAVLAGR